MKYQRYSIDIMRLIRVASSQIRHLLGNPVTWIEIAWIFAEILGLGSKSNGFVFEICGFGLTSIGFLLKSAELR